MARLIIYEEINGTDTVYETFYLQDSRVIIGSDQDNQLILEMPDVDPMHASLEMRDNHWFLQDLGGPGGTGVNGRLIEGPRRLRHNDIIELGFIRMRFQIDDARGITEEIPQYSPEMESEVESETAQAEGQLSGRVWFAGLAVATSAVIFVILMLFAAAHMLGLINIVDLLPGG